MSKKTHFLLAPFVMAFILGACSSPEIIRDPYIVIWPPTNEITLTENIWANGAIATDDPQWFKFTAPATEAYYIHFEPGTLSSVYVLLYNSDGGPLGSRTYLSSNTRSISKPLTSGNEYFICIMPSNTSTGRKGVYRMGFNTSDAPPPIELPNNATLLAENAWASGNLAADSEQWFTFTATAVDQYLHFEPGSLEDVYVQLYDDTGTLAGSRTNLDGAYSGGILYTSLTLTIGEKYFIKVTPYSTYYSGTYKIAFNASDVTPLTSLPASAIQLTANIWTNGSIATANGEQWFKFKATADGQTIHFEPGTLNAVTVQLYDSACIPVGNRTRLSGSNLYTSHAVTTGEDYYIRVTPYNGSGAYKITFNTIPLPFNSNVTALTVNKWAGSNLSDSIKEQWFTFTATAPKQYIHFESGALGVSIRLYDSAGTTVGSWTNQYPGSLSVSLPVTSANSYYIRVTPYSSGGVGAFKMAFSASSAEPED